jgi:hypothetical protein
MPNQYVPLMPLEIQEEDLMNNAEIQEQAAMAANQPANIFIGRIQILERPPLELFSQHSMGKAPGFTFFDHSGLWGKFFAPSNGKKLVCTVPAEWANFFTASLLSPRMFGQTKEFMGAKTLINALGEDSSVGFVLPQSCPVKKSLTCVVDDEHKEFTDLEKAGASQTEEIVAIQAEEQTGAKLAELELGQTDNGSSVEKLLGKEVLSQEGCSEDIEKSSSSRPYCKKKANGKIIIVDTEVRRSPRVKTQKGGFKDPKCCNKNCLGCNVVPPMLSNKAIRKMGSALCDLDTELMSDDALSKKKKTAPVGKTKKKKTTPVGKKFANEALQDDDDNVAETSKL